VEDGELTLANTEPLKIQVHWANFYEETAKPYSTCFTVHAWSFTGAMNPGLPPPYNDDAYQICLGCLYNCTTSSPPTTSHVGTNARRPSFSTPTGLSS